MEQLRVDGMAMTLRLLILFLLTALTAGAQVIPSSRMVSGNTPLHSL